MELPDNTVISLTPSAALARLPRQEFTYSRSEQPAEGKEPGERWVNGSGMVFTWCPPGKRKAGRLSSGWEYRVPTEAEWEYACRAGTDTAYAFGNSASPKDFKPLAELWSPPHQHTTAYEVFMEHPYHEGHIYFRTKDGRIACYDLRREK